MSVLPVDVTRDETIAAAKERIGDETGGRLDMLLNVAGVLHIPGKMQPEVSFDRITSENINRAFQVNAIGPMLTARHMIPLLAKGGDKKAGKPAVLASLSARVGSISDNSLGGWYSYRASKVRSLTF